VVDNSARQTLTAMDLVTAFDDGTSIDRQKFLPITLLEQAETLQFNCVKIRSTRGELPVGIKIGFTNRSIWPLYNVTHPVWAPVYRETVLFAKNNSAITSIKNACEPRIEPEIVFGLKAGASPKSATIEEVFSCIDWVAHGFEIVQSPYPQWKFSAAEAFAAQGLHYKLVIGEKHAVRSLGGNATDLDDWLAKLKVTLRCNSDAVASGRGANVLGSPLQALCHLVAELMKRQQALTYGAIITTGTMTDALPICPGEQWATEFDRQALGGLTLNITA
jgi:2-keto-4-pentenoate hydratase